MASICALDFEYLQPHVSAPRPGDRDAEVPMLLMYAPTRPAVEGNVTSLAGSDCDRMVKLLWTVIYPDGVDTDARRYRAYLSGFYEKHRRTIPRTVRLLDAAQLRAALTRVG